MRSFLALMGLLFSFSVNAQQDVSQIFANAEQLRKSNDLIRAIDEYDRALKIAPDDIRCHFMKGMCYFSLKDYDNAINSFTRVTTIKPEHVQAYTMLAKCYHEKDLFNKELESYDLAFKYDSDPAKKLQYKLQDANLAIQKEKYDIALKYVQDAKQLDPENLQVLYYEGLVYNKLKRYHDAKAILTKAIALLPSKEPKVIAKYYFELGFAHNKLKEYDKAHEAFKHANFGVYKPIIAKLSPEYYTMAAQSYMLMGDLDEAKQLLDIALQMNPEYTRAYILQANLAQRRTNQTVAINYYKKAASLEKDPKVLESIHTNLIRLLLDNGMYDDVIALAEDAVRHDEKNFHILFAEGIALHRKKELSKAVQAFEALEQFHHTLSPDQKAQFHFMLGITYKEMKEFAKAKEHFHKAMHGAMKAIAEIELEEMESAAANNKTDELMSGF
ncbi:MAG: tetratricopeptide repeat protein [Cytophagales bacterium]|nr:tetratricopeptide repeat protein [Cytophagales bacterium]MDW8383502.1 tetratricopeptide repeat protein [Flammeovirgaceae bacterium]